MRNIPYTHIVWDFNGTVFDDAEASVRSISRLLVSRGKKPVTADEYREVFDFPVSEYYKKLGFDLEKESFESLSEDFFRFYNEESRYSELRHGVPEIISMAKQSGIRNIILSATEKNMLRRQTDELGITGSFDEIIGLDDFSAKSKAEKAEEWADTLIFPHILLIGDTCHDYDTARILNADCFLLTGGHHSASRLRRCDGAEVFESVEELENRLFG